MSEATAETAVTAIENVPQKKAEAYDWLVKLSHEKAEADFAFNEACKAVAEKFKLNVSDIKAGIKALEQDNADEVISRLGEKIEIIQEITGIQ